MRSIFATIPLLVSCTSALARPEPLAEAMPENAMYLAPAYHLIEARGYTRDQALNKSTTTACSNIHIIIDRATNEEPSQGVIGTLATLVSERIPGTTVEWVDYPAVLFPYDQSTDAGSRMTKEAVRSYADNCPAAKLILMGYSQGAQVVGDVLVGGGGAIGLGPMSDPLEDNYLKRIVAAIQMGDPRFAPNQPWDVGTNSNLQGVFPRPPGRGYESVATILRSYCDVGDPFCAVPGLDQDIHASYDERYNEDAFAFVKARIDNSITGKPGKKGDGSRPSPVSSAILALGMFILCAVSL